MEAKKRYGREINLARKRFKKIQILLTVEEMKRWDECYAHYLKLEMGRPFRTEMFVDMVESYTRRLIAIKEFQTEVYAV